MSRRTIVAALACCLALNPLAAAAQPAMWIVRDADSEIVLFGSVHVLPKDLEWRPPALTEALARADDLWFEIRFDTFTQARFGALAQANGYMPPKRLLRDMLSRSGRERLTRVCRELRIPQAEIERMRPWLAEIRISAAALAREQAGADQGVELRLSADAPATARREAFETPELQISLFADAPVAEQVASLEQTLRELETDRGAYRRLVEAWMAGDPRRLEAEGLAPLRRASPALYRRLVTDRNVKWVETLRQRLAGSGRTVVVVGAGHLAGPDGLPARLRALGYQVEGP